MASEEGAFTLIVPIDMSQIGAGAGEQELKVVAQGLDGSLISAEVRREGDAGSAKLQFSEHPGPLRLLAGPQRARDEDLANSQTVTVDVPRHSWSAERRLTLPPIRISPYFWYWWLRWCREYVIRGRVVCADGSPVPAATVCAYDVDWWFWWTSTELVGCDTTDINGAFEITFRSCCGWWPWWWWQNRVWQIDSDLVERVGAVLERDPRLKLGRAANQPSLDVFNEILAPTGVPVARALQASDIGRLEQIRGTLLAKLPAAAELENLRVWPWWPWWPWWDCTPDIIFRVTQDCNTAGTVILSEGIGATRWNIPDPLEVVLTANELACCRRSPCPDRPCREGDCIDVSDICGSPVNDISGNPGAPAMPAGFPAGLLAPGAVTPGSAGWAGDRPYAGAVNVEKANVMTGVDYYEIEYSTTGAPGSFGALPTGAAEGFSRSWLKPPPPVWTSGAVPFPFVTMSGHNVVESREHYETASGFGAGGEFWTGNAELVVPIDSTKFPDGTYWFHVIGWKIDGVGNLIKPQVLPVCDTEIENGWVLTFDNRVDPDPGASLPCGPGTVHLCVTQPDTQFVDVLVNGAPVDPCAVVDATTGTLVVDFVAHDADGWLGGYTLQATYGSNLSRDLLSQPSAQLTAITADCVGPTYGQALLEPGMPATACATAPYWHGGKIRLTVDLSEAFPVPCCYQLQLRAWTRHLVNCDDVYWNLSEYTIGVGVCPPQPSVHAER